MLKLTLQQDAVLSEAVSTLADGLRTALGNVARSGPAAASLKAQHAAEMQPVLARHAQELAALYAQHNAELAAIEETNAAALAALSYDEYASYGAQFSKVVIATAAKLRAPVDFVEPSITKRLVADMVGFNMAKSAFKEPTFSQIRAAHAAGAPPAFICKLFRYRLNVVNSIITAKEF